MSAQIACTPLGELGLKYPLNEYSAMWKMGNEPLVERLRINTTLYKINTHIQLPVY